jgi:hypothetical protein
MQTEFTRLSERLGHPVTVSGFAAPTNRIAVSPFVKLNFGFCCGA